MYFEPQVLHTPAELCSEMVIKICKLGRYWQNFANDTQIGEKTCLNTHF